MRKNSEAEQANLGTCRPFRMIGAYCTHWGAVKMEGWKWEQGADHVGPCNVKEFVRYLKGYQEAKLLKQGYDMFSLNSTV